MKLNWIAIGRFSHILKLQSIFINIKIEGYDTSILLVTIFEMEVTTLTMKSTDAGLKNGVQEQGKEMKEDPQSDGEIPFKNIRRIGSNLL